MAKLLMGDEMSADFALDQFWNTSPEDRVKRCRQMAVLATQLADNASGNAKRDYLELAKQWHILANELEAWTEASTS